MQNEYDFEPNDEKSLQESALAIVSFVEALENIVGNLSFYVDTLPAEHKEEGRLYTKQLKTLLATIDDDVDMSNLIKDTEMLMSQFPAKIKRLGVAKELIVLVKEKGFSRAAAAERLGLADSTVDKFFRAYDKASPSIKQKIKKNNVYDIERNMQNLHASLLRQIARFESDGEISARFLSEYRQTIALAEKQLKEWNSKQKIDRLGALIQEVMVKYCNPEARQLIIKEFSQLGIKGLTAEAQQVERLNPIDVTPS